jgi:sugar lactone lactonase YvrE
MAQVRVLFQGPGPKANGLAAAEDGLWVCDQVDNRIYKVRYQDGAVLTRFDTPGRNLSGCGFGGGSVWGGSNVRPAAVTRHDPATGWCLAYLLLPNGMEGGVHGLEWYQGALWVTRPGFLTLQKLDPESGALLQEIPFPETRSHGVYFEDGCAVVNGTNTGNVYKLDLADGRVVDRWRVEGFEAHGMTRAPDGRVWICDAETNRIGVVEDG